MKNTINKLDRKNEYDGQGIMVPEVSSNSQHGRKSHSAGAIYHGATGRSPKSLWKPSNATARRSAPKSPEAELADLIGPRQTRAQKALEEKMAEQAKFAKARQMAAEARKNGDFDREKRTTATRCVQKSIHGEGLEYNE